MIRRSLDVRAGALSAHDAAHGAHEAAEDAILDQFAKYWADCGSACGEYTDLDLNEGPYAGCCDADCESLSDGLIEG